MKFWVKEAFVAWGSQSLRRCVGGGGGGGSLGFGRHEKEFLNKMGGLLAPSRGLGLSVVRILLQLTSMLFQ